MSLQERLKAERIPYVEMTPWQIRIDGELDIWPKRGKWHDIVTGERGQCDTDLIAFVKLFFTTDREKKVSEVAFIDTLMNIGWSREDAEAEAKRRNG